jgi:hypothetical protein
MVSGIWRASGGLVGGAAVAKDATKTIAEQNHFDAEKVRNHDTSIMLGYLIVSVIFLVALYSASMVPGTVPGDFASMVASP